jgi:hypothetical protein
MVNNPKKKTGPRCAGYQIQNPLKTPKSQNPLSKDPRAKPQGLWVPGEPHAQVVVAESRLAPAAVSRPRPPGAAVPRTAAQNEKARITHTTLFLTLITIFIFRTGPFPNIASRVM